MRHAPRALLAGGLGFAVSVLVAACGGSNGLLSSDQASTLRAQLASVSSALASGDCNGLHGAVANLANSALNLPASVNPTLRADVVQGVSTVGELAQQQCQPRATTTAAPTTSTQTAATSVPTTTATTSTTTPTTTTATTPTVTVPPPTTSTATTTGGPGTTTTGAASGGVPPGQRPGGPHGAGSGGAGLGNGNGNSQSGGNGPGNGNGG